MADEARLEAFRILAVDDESYILDLYRDILRHYAGLQLVTCSRGDEAVETVESAREDGLSFAVAFLDIHMDPGPDGIWTAERIRRLDPQVEIVMVTGFSGHHPGEIVRRIPPPHKLLYLQKPFSPHEIYQFAFSLSHKWKAEKELVEIQRDLESRVRKRTTSLQEVNLRLQEEVQRCLMTEKALRKSEDRYRRLNEELEERIRERTAELTESLKMLKGAQAQLVQSEKMAALGSLVAGVAHEINTPVGIGITAASLLWEKSRELDRLVERGELKRSDLRHYLEANRESSRMILSNLQRAAELIRSFKQVAVDQCSEKRRRFLVGEYVEDVLASLRPHFKSTPHRVSVRCPENLEIYSYPGAFSQILTNLVMNSLVHGFENGHEGTMTVEFLPGNGKLRWVYRDNGRGVDEENAHRIFDPFFTTRRGRGGTGLGLHIVYNIVTRQLGGAIRLMSKPEKGAVFEIEIPMETETEHEATSGS